VTRSYICVLSNTLGLTWKKLDQKFTVENANRYIDYKRWIRGVDLKRVKYLDEVAFGPHGLWRTHGRAPVGQRVAPQVQLHTDSRIGVIMMCSIDGLHQQPWRCEFCSESNNAATFVEYVRGSIEDGFLGDGDFLLVDNARIHASADEWQGTVHTISFFP
jgi:hypothetical protein